MSKKNVDWEEIRTLFPALETYVYLNAAEGSPLSLPVYQAAKSFYDEMLKQGDLLWSRWVEKKEMIRKRIANWINAESDEIAFVANTSQGMNIIAQMLKGEGRVLTLESEFPSSTIPFLHQDFDVKFVPASEDSVYSIQGISEKLDRGTKILVMSHVQYNTGFRQNLEKIGTFCRQHGLIFVVNATQSIGAFPIDVKRQAVDFLVFNGLKWPGAGYGIGGLYINQKFLNHSKSPIAGWQSVKHPDQMNNRDRSLKKSASVLEPGVPAFPNIFALGASFDFFSSIGQDNITQRILELSQYLEDRLKSIRIPIVSNLDPAFRSGIMMLKVNQPDAILRKLRKHKIIVSVRNHLLRVSVHIYNNFEDIDSLVKGLQN